MYNYIHILIYIFNYSIYIYIYINTWTTAVLAEVRLCNSGQASPAAEFLLGTAGLYLKRAIHRSKQLPRSS